MNFYAIVGAAMKTDLMRGAARARGFSMCCEINIHFIVAKLERLDCFWRPQVIFGSGTHSLVLDQTVGQVTASDSISSLLLNFSTTF